MSWKHSSNKIKSHNLIKSKFYLIQINIIKELIEIIIFLLCFSNEEECFWILNEFIKKILNGKSFE